LASSSQSEFFTAAEMLPLHLKWCDDISLNRSWEAWLIDSCATRHCGPPHGLHVNQTAFDNASAIRVCQPGPVAFQRANVSGGNRREIDVRALPDFGRPRGFNILAAVPAPKVSGSTSRCLASACKGFLRPRRVLTIGLLGIRLALHIMEVSPPLRGWITRGYRPMARGDALTSASRRSPRHPTPG
jgi:hypothetical protein